MNKRDLPYHLQTQKNQDSDIKGTGRLVKHAQKLRQLLGQHLGFGPNKHCLMCGDLTNHDLAPKEPIEQNKQLNICRACQGYLIKPQHPCQRCGVPLNDTAVYCGKCLKNPPDFDSTYSPYVYTAPLDKLISQFKHGGDHIMGKELSRLFCTAIDKHYRERHLAMPKWIIPVPLHWRRQWHRGFNQAAFLAKDIVTSQAGIRSNTQFFHYAKKKRTTASQEQLSRKERLNNTKNAFIITQALKGESVAIVDDVMTTGATVGSLAKSLKKSGAGKIAVWALARTPDA